MKKLKKEQEIEILSDDILSVLSSSGRSRHVEDFPISQIYIEEVGSFPFVKKYNAFKMDFHQFVEGIMKMGAEIVFLSETIDEDSFEMEIDKGVYKINKGYYAIVDSGYEPAENFSSFSEYIRAMESERDLVMVANVEILCPPASSSLKNKKIEDSIHALVKKCALQRNTSAAHVGMICQEDGEFYIKDFIIKDYVINNPDLHYGEGFSEFHRKMMLKFKNNTKGLFLLYGDPGTGKTYYIRSLLKELQSMGKYVIYLPPNMIDYMISPDMIGFLSELVINEAEKGKSCILLLEDAEPLLVSRNLDDRRSNGITNLLNITDGLLNDMFSVQVVATFNTTLSKIDEALLRPERLVARKEFRKLKREDAQKLADFLGLAVKIEKDSTLAEIYSMNKQNEILIHEYNDNRSNTVGFKI